MKPSGLCSKTPNDKPANLKLAAQLDRLRKKRKASGNSKPNNNNNDPVVAMAVVAL
jgi:hypothetical protein